MMVRHRLPPHCRYSGLPHAGWPTPNSNEMARAVGRSAAAWAQQRWMRARTAAGVSGCSAAESARSPRETLTVMAPRPGTFPAASSHACCRPAWNAHRHSPKLKLQGRERKGQQVSSNTRIPSLLHLCSYPLFYPLFCTSSPTLASTLSSSPLPLLPSLLPPLFCTSSPHTSVAYGFECSSLKSLGAQ